MGSFIEVRLEFPEEGITQSTFVQHLGDNLYQVEDISSGMWNMLQYRDIIEADLQSDGALIFRRVVQASDWQNDHFVLNQELYKREELEKVLRAVEAIGGKWERVMGGILTVYLPPESSFDVKEAIDEVVGVQKT